VRREFEVVCQGGTNSWGHDWDAFGNLWFINTVIGHLWQGIPGAWFKRMYGEHLAPRRYELIDQHADHYHWNTGRSWTDSRDGAHGADALGGGHAHSGLLVYQGDNWPTNYRGDLFTLNFHGRRFNREHLEPRGSGWTGRHQPDMVQFTDTWFRGVDLATAPDGSVYVLDWSDTGECHENDADGVHRENGRVFRVAHGTPPSPAIRDVSRLSDLELARLHRHPNEWFVRQARRILQERHAAGRDLQPAQAALMDQFHASTQTPDKLRALWTLHVSGAAPAPFLRRQLEHPDPDIRAWSVTLLAERRPVESAIAARFTALAATEPSARTRLALASALQRLELNDRAPLAAALLSHAADAADHNLPLLIWYGLEPALSAALPEARGLYASCQIPKVRELIARRLAEDLERKPG
jgi:hypothetical protein